MIKKIFSYSFVLILLIFSCNSDSDDNSSEVWEQKSEMLTNWADNFISPSYTTLTNKLLLLEESSADTPPSNSSEFINLHFESWSIFSIVERVLK